MSVEKSEVAPEGSVLELEIGQLDLGEIEVSALSTEDSFGVPEMAASSCYNSCYGCTTFSCSGG